MEAPIPYRGPCPAGAEPEARRERPRRRAGLGGALQGCGTQRWSCGGSAASSSLLFQKEERCGPFSSNLRGAAVQVAGNSLPEARPRCSEPATGLAACCIHLTAVCIPALSLPDSLPRLAMDAGGPEQPLVIPALTPRPPSR